MSEDKQLIVSTETKQDAMAIIDRLAAENPEMTIKEYLEKHHKEIMILR